MKQLVELAINCPSTVTGYELDMLLRESYDDTYHITDLDDPMHPMGIVEVSDKEALWELGPRATLMRQFRLYEVHKHFGLNWGDFINQPRHVCDFIIEELRLEEARNRQRALEQDRDLSTKEFMSGFEIKSG